MAGKIIGFFVTSFVVVTLTTGILQAEERIKALDRMMYTINPIAKMSGPVFRDMGDRSEKSKYGTALVSLILKEADSKARKYLEAGDNQAYYAFLALSLTVPLHEGLYVHFRNVDGDVCRVDVNNGDLVKKAGATTYKIFTDTFKSSTNAYFPNCEEMNKTVGVNQMIRGGDGTDLSLMQVSIRWHFDDFLANKKYESVQKTVNYGLSHLLKGFDPVYRNVADYKCISEAGLSIKKKISYINLIRGIWAGKYNSGSISQTCRFADPNSPFKKNDINFSKNLDKILGFNGVISPDFIGDLVIEGPAGAAIREVVFNLKNNKNNRRELDKVINSFR